MSNQTLFIMKKKLLYLTSIMLFSISAINAQTTTWDIGNNSTVLNDATAITTEWPIGTAFLSETVKSGLGIFPGSGVTTFGAISGQVASGFSDGYTCPNRFPTGGASGGSATALPTTRYLYFNVSGACTIKVWFKGGNTTSTRTLFVSDGTTVLGSGASVNGAALIVSATATAAGKHYVYCDNGNSIYKIEITGATVNTPALSTKDFQKELDVTVFAKDGKINLSNIKSSTTVNVYNVLGALVKTAQVDADSSLDINGGVYIVNAKSAEGEKSVKVIVP